MTLHRGGGSGPEILLYDDGLTEWRRQCEEVEHMVPDDGVSPIP